MCVHCAQDQVHRQHPHWSLIQLAAVFASPNTAWGELVVGWTKNTSRIVIDRATVSVLCLRRVVAFTRAFEHVGSAVQIVRHHKPN